MANLSIEWYSVCKKMTRGQRSHANHILPRDGNMVSGFVAAHSTFWLRSGNLLTFDLPDDCKPKNFDYGSTLLHLLSTHLSERMAIEDSQKAR